MKKHRVLPSLGTLGSNFPSKVLASKSTLRASRSMKNLTERQFTEKTKITSKHSSYLKNSILTSSKKIKPSRRVTYQMNLFNAPQSESNLRQQMLWMIRKRKSVSTLSTSSACLPAVGDICILCLHGPDAFHGIVRETP